MFVAKVSTPLLTTSTAKTLAKRAEEAEVGEVEEEAAVDLAATATVSGTSKKKKKKRGRQGDLRVDGLRLKITKKDRPHRRRRDLDKDRITLTDIQVLL